ncbi:MAG: dTMP kinase, partial [Bacilli bacterium]|nr:dTMP kinase [Bacilli bacterium]
RKVDRLDLETIEFHEKVYEGYMIIAKKFSDRFKIVNGQNPVEQVVEDTIKILKTVI